MTTTITHLIRDEAGEYQVQSVAVYTLREDADAAMAEIEDQRGIQMAYAATDEEGTEQASDAEQSDPDEIWEIREDGSSEDDASDEERPNSVVQRKYKDIYKARAAEMKVPKGVSRKAMKRSTCDWLALELMKRTLTSGRKPSLKVEAFEAILDANGVEHRHWNRSTNGWQGRLRMTGRLALQRVVAEAGELQLPGEEPQTPPRAWIAKYNNA